MPGETAVTGGIEREEKIGDGLALRASPTGFEQSKCDANRRRAGQSVDIDCARLRHIRARPVGSKLPRAPGKHRGRAGAESAAGLCATRIRQTRRRALTRTGRAGGALSGTSAARISQTAHKTYSYEHFIE